MGWLVSEQVLTGVALYFAFTLLALWLALILWSWQDMGARSRSASLRFLSALLVALLNLPGLLIYLMLRPGATLVEKYERSLEEELLLQGIEQGQACPDCKARTRPEWQLCPACHRQLRHPCTSCGKALEPEWERCPYCSSRQTGVDNKDWVLAPRRFRPGTLATRPGGAATMTESDEPAGRSP